MLPSRTGANLCLAENPCVEETSAERPTVEYLQPSTDTIVLNKTFLFQKRFGLRVLDYVITSNHIHLLVKVKTWRFETVGSSRKKFVPRLVDIQDDPSLPFARLVQLMVRPLHERCRDDDQIAPFRFCTSTMSKRMSTNPIQNR
jgi:hypothetical protein